MGRKGPEIQTLAFKLKLREMGALLLYPTGEFLLFDIKRLFLTQW